MKDFEKNGYLILDNFISDEEISTLRNRALELTAEFNPEDEQSVFHSFFHGDRKKKDDYILQSADKIHFFLEEKALDEKGKLLRPKAESICKIGHGLHDRDAVFDRFSRSEKIKQLAHALGFKGPLLAQSMYFFKNPQIGGEIGLHQDASFIFTEPSSVVGFWFALEDATIENSCLWVLPQGHKEELRSKFIRTENGCSFTTFDHAPFKTEDFIPLEVKKGSLVVLHGHLPHYSTENHSTKSRHAYTLHLIEGNFLYPTENWLQRPSEMPFRGF